MHHNRGEVSQPHEKINTVKNSHKHCDFSHTFLTEKHKPLPPYFSPKCPVHTFYEANMRNKTEATPPSCICAQLLP